jgi:hypothetical protein
MDMLELFPDLILSLNPHQIPKPAKRVKNVVIWEGLQEVMLILTKLYYVRLFDTA